MKHRSVLRLLSASNVLHWQKLAIEMQIIYAQFYILINITINTDYHIIQIRCIVSQMI